MCVGNGRLGGAMGWLVRGGLVGREGRRDVSGGGGCGRGGGGGKRRWRRR